MISMGSRAFKACYSVVTAASGNTPPPLGGGVTGPSRRGFSVIIGLTIGSHAQQASIPDVSVCVEGNYCASSQNFCSRSVSFFPSLIFLKMRSAVFAPHPFKFTNLS